jgi:small conductance mechanosensitive channel
MLERWLDWLSQRDWPALASEWGLRVLAGFALLYLGAKLSRRISRASELALHRAGVDVTAATFLRKLVYVGLMVVVILAVLQIFNVPISSAFAVLGAAGLAIGLALKDSLSNVASGVGLVTLKPFRVGDVVTIAGMSGKVESVSIFQTVLRGTDNQTITLPNNLITSSPIVNLTPDKMRRIELVIGIDYGDDIETARQAAMTVIRADARVLQEPVPDVLVYALGSSGVDLGIRCHVANDDFFVTKCDLLERIKAAFEEAGVSIPYPQQDMHLYVRDASGKPVDMGKALSR